jgi:hypothetical protein
LSALLTQNTVRAAIPIITAAYDAALKSGLLKRPDFHMVFLDPTKPFCGDTSKFRDAILGQHSFTDPSGWENPYDRIARAKARATWRTGLSTRVIRECMPHMLDVGDTRYGGSVILDGIIVAGSGVQPWYDEMFSGIGANVLRGLANDYMQTVIIPGGKDFLDQA